MMMMMIPSFVTTPTQYSLEYVIERSAESIVGYLRISKPDKALQVLLDLLTYVQSLPMGSCQHMKVLVARVKEELSGMQEEYTREGHILSSVLDTLERMTLMDSDLVLLQGNEQQQLEEQQQQEEEEEETDMMVIDEGDDVECQRCGNIIPNRRLPQHMEYWCQGL